MTAVLPVRRPGAALQLPPGEADTTPAAGRWNGRARHLVARAYPWFARVVVALAALLFLLLAIGPHVLGYRTMTMLTGSMAPQINPGDVVVSTPVATRDLRPGLVITYHIPIDDHRVVTHRIVSIQQGTDGSVTVQTKGDANKTADPWKATLRGDTVFQVRAVIPELGYGIEALRAPAVRTVLVYGAPALLAGWLLMGIWRKDDENDIQTDDVDSDVDSDEREKEGSA
jgi:signal peptidase I